MWLVGVFFELYVFEILKSSVRDKHAMISHDFFAFTSWWQFFQMKDFPWIFQGARVSDDPRERDLQISCEPGRCVGSQNLREMIGRCDIFWSRCQLVGLLSSLLVMFFSVFSIIFCSMKGLLTRSLLRITNHQHQHYLAVDWSWNEWLAHPHVIFKTFKTRQTVGRVQIISGESKVCYNSRELFKDQSNLIRAKILFPFKARLNAWLVSFAW